MARSHKDLKAAVVRRGADHMHIRSEPRTREDRKHRLEILLRNLKDGARLFGEEHLQRIAVRQLHPHAASARDRHFGKRHRQSAVAAVVVGERQLPLHDLLHRVEEPLHALRIGIGVLAAELVVHLRETTAAKSVLPMPQVNINKR